MSLALPKMAVYFDAENIGLSCVPGVLRHFQQVWDTHIKRAYGAHLLQFAPILRDYGVVPVEVVPQENKKNAADIALIIDAMQELCLGSAQAFCIVTGDRDFIQLVQRIREMGKTVFVCGLDNTPLPLRSACTQFLALRTPGEAAKTPQPAPQPPPAPQLKAKESPPSVLDLNDPAVAEEARRALREAFLHYADGDDAVELSYFGGYLAAHAPHLSQRRYGVRKLTNFLERVGGFQLSAVENGDHGRKIIRLQEQKKELGQQSICEAARDSRAAQDAAQAASSCPEQLPVQSFEPMLEDAE